MNKENIIEEIILLNPKNWNEKVENYDKIINEIKSGSSVDYFDNNPGIIKSVFNECNALAFEKALEMILVYFEISEIGKKNMKSESSIVIEKCFKQNRQQTKSFGIEILLTLSDKYTQETIDILMGYFGNNKPSVVSGVLETLLQIVRRIKNLQVVKEVAKKLPMVLDSRDKLSRDLSKKLSIEICSIFGREKIEPFLKDLKPILLTELQSEFDKLQENRSKLAVNADESKTVGIDLLSKIPGDFYEKIDGTRQERKELLDNLLSVMPDGVTISNGNYRELVRKLCQIMNRDSQIPTVIVAVKILHQLALGLRKNFSQYSVLVIESCFEKFKEKKPVVLLIVRDLIDRSFNSINLESITEIVLKSIENKNPSVRMEIVGFLLRIVKNIPDKSTIIKSIKQLMPALRRLCDDSDAKVRESVFQLIGEFLSIAGNKQLQPFLEKLDSTKLLLIESFVTRPNPDQPTSNIDHVPVKETLIIEPKKTEKPIPAPLPAQAPARVVKEILITEQDVDEKLFQLLGNDVWDKLTSQVWKNRLDVCDRALQWLVKQDSIDRVMCQLMMKLIIRKPGLKDSNILVVKKKLHILQESFRKCENKVTMLIIEICLGEIVDKIGDIKLGSIAKDCLSVVCSTVVHNNTCCNTTVILRSLQCLTESKSVRNVTENLEWITEYLSNHTSRLSVVKDMLCSLRQLLAFASPIVKQNTVTLIGVLYMNHGKSIVNYFESEKPSIIDMISKEVLKVDKVMKQKKLDDQEAENKIEKKTENKEKEIGSVEQLDELNALNILQNQNEKHKTEYSIPQKMCSYDEEESTNADMSSYKAEREARDDCRSFVLDICDKLEFYTNRHSKSVFQRELCLFFSSMKPICDTNKKECIDILLTSLRDSWMETESISVQTDFETNPIEKTVDNPNLGEFINVRKHRRGHTRNTNDQENVTPEQEIERRIKPKYNQFILQEKASNDCTNNTHVTVVTEIIKVLTNETFSFIIYENLSRLKRLLRDEENRKQIRDHIPALVTSLTCHISISSHPLASDAQELETIFRIIDSLYSEPVFVDVIHESVLSKLFHQLFTVLVNPSFKADLFIESKRLLTLLILQIAETSKTNEVLCSMLILLSQSIKSTKINYSGSLIKSTAKVLEVIKTRNKYVDIDFGQVLSILNEPFTKYSNDPAITNTTIFKIFKTVVDLFTKRKQLELLNYLPKDENTELKNYIHKCYDRQNQI